MNKRKIFIFIGFLFVVLGSIFFLSHYVFAGYYDPCLCSPDDLYTVASHQCLGDSSFVDMIVRDSYCLSGTCYFRVTVYCEIWGGNNTTPTFLRFNFTYPLYNSSCCDWNVAWD
jgi:hypothetical protein